MSRGGTERTRTIVGEDRGGLRGSAGRSRSRIGLLRARVRHGDRDRVGLVVVVDGAVHGAVEEHLIIVHEHHRRGGGSRSLRKLAERSLVEVRGHRQLISCRRQHLSVLLGSATASAVLVVISSSTSVSVTTSVAAATAASRVASVAAISALVCCCCVRCGRVVIVVVSAATAAAVVVVTAVVFVFVVVIIVWLGFYYIMRIFIFYDNISWFYSS